MTSKKKDITKSTIGDVIHANVKGGLGAIPGFGSLLSENFALLVTSPATKRRDEFLFAVEKDLRALETKVENFNIEALSQNELFVTTLLQAIQIAIRTHQQEKLEALRNAVINTALATDPKEDMQLMFLNWIDTLTPWHLRILKMLKTGHCINMSIDRNNIANVMELIQLSYPNEIAEINNREQQEFFMKILRDLANYGLIHSNHINNDTVATFYLAPPNIIGEFFLAFIESPLQDKA